MPKNLTETSNFDTPIVVPLGSDSHSTLAEYIEAIAQKLTNRSKWLQDIVSRTNTWAIQQLFDTGQNPDMPYVISSRHPGECNVTGTPEPTNPWRMFAKFPTGVTDVNVRLYWGSGAEGHFAIVYNAYWRPHNQRWRQEAAGSYSFAVLVGGLGTSFVSKDPASSDWLSVDWQQAASVNANAVDVATVNASESYVGSYYYTGSQAKVQQLQLSSAFGPLSAAELRTSNRIMFDSGLASGELAKGIKWPIPILPDGTIGDIKIAFYIANSGDSFQWYRRRQLDDYSTSYTTVGSAVTTDGVNQAYKLISPPSGIQENDEYELCWKLQDATDVAQVNSNRVYALRRDYTKYGPW